MKVSAKPSGLAKEEEEESQINTLIYAMGDQADDILTSFKLSTSRLKQYHTVKTKFDEHFVVRRSIIFERAKYNRRAKRMTRLLTHLLQRCTHSLNTAITEP